MANRETLQKNLNANYDLEFFQRNVLHPVFGNSLTLASIPEKRNINASEERLIKSVKKYGMITLADYRELDLYDVELVENVVIERSKVSIGAAIKKYIFANNAVLVNFHYQNQPAKSWRLSFIAKEQQIEEGEIVKGETNPKRYTYVLGQNETCRTAAERFAKLSLDSDFTIDKFKEAFSVEKLSKSFFDKYKEHYLHFVEHLGKRNFKATVFNGDEKAIRDFAKKLLGRIVFLYFVQKKNWLGASSNQYKDGKANFLEELFILSGKNENFYNQWLKELFYDSLNNPNRTDENFKLPDGKNVKIPFLNGGLFEDDDPKGILTFPPKLFADLFEFFKQYNFTIYEDSPDDHTVAVDPEMLGHIFENLLEDNKDKGAYYTPKEIVHYMCQESLIEYLTTKLSIADTTTFQQLGKEQTEIFGNDGKKGQLTITQEHKSKSTSITRADVEQFIKHKQVTDEIKKNEKDINKYLDTIKICDPAIGSGAFPMGLLHEIFNAKLLLNDETGVNAAEVKQNIIQYSIYGVDIENGAVDIARLRFWLSLIVDEDKPRPLPNLDYKIVVGDSLVPKFEGEVVDIDWDLREAVGEAKPYTEKIKSGLNEIVEAQKKFFSEENPEKKKRFVEKIRNLKIDLLINQLTFDKLKYKAKNSVSQQLFEQTSKDRQRELEIKLKIAGYDDTIKKLQVLKSKPTRQLKFFDWKLDFPEIINPAIAGEKCGFDIVIGNPPYKIVKATNTPKEELDKLLKFSSADFKVNLFALFLEQATNLAKAKGTCSFIIPDSSLNLSAFKKLREFILKNAALRFVSQYNEAVFQNAEVGKSVILQFSKATKNDSFLFRSFETSLNYSESKIEITRVEKDDGKKFVYKSNESGAEALLDKLKSIKTKLEFFCDVYDGINPGSEEIKNTVITQKRIDKDSKKIIDGKCFHKFTSIDWEGDYVYYNEAFVEKLRSKIVARGESFTGRIIKKSNFFVHPKIVTRQTSDSVIGTLDLENYFVKNSVHSTLLNEQFKNQVNLKTILCILNSKVIDWFYKTESLESGRLFPQVKIERLRTLPILLPSDESKWISLVEKIIEMKSDGRVSVKLENEIDLMVYKLYQLTYDEVLVIDKEFEKEMSREEYDKKDFGFEYVQPDTTAAQVKTNGKQKGKNLNLDMLKDLEL